MLSAESKTHYAFKRGVTFQRGQHLMLHRIAINGVRLYTSPTACLRLSCT